MKSFFSVLICSLLPSLSSFAGESSAQRYDVVVYGGTCSAVTAAVQVSKMGKSVVIVSPDIHLGGLTSGGLGCTDIGNPASIGGLAYEFYERVWKKYEEPKAWKFQRQKEFGDIGRGNRALWRFEPHVAEAIFEDWIAEHKIPVFRDAWLDREKGVEKVDGKIVSIRTLCGKKFSGARFLDATYEGDLMAAAGISYHVGREANSLYGEEWNGNQVGVLHHRHWLRQGAVDPYKIPGDPGSGLLKYVSADPPGVRGEADHRVQAYCYRVCMTNHPENRLPFPKPEGYDPEDYELMLRVFKYGWREMFHKFDPVPNRKTDTNNHGPFSSDFIGENYEYPDASYEKRKEIIEAHVRYQKGLLYFTANDPRVPRDVRTKMSEWGLPKDEFVDNGHWPHQLYIREARRMIGDSVMTENECLGRRQVSRPVGLGSYGLDSHNVRRYVTPEGYVQNEGDIGVGVKKPYGIDYGSLVPKRSECTNLLVPVCVSSSHIAFGSIRMEPIFMILGQSAATAAVLSIEANKAVQDLDYGTLRHRLETDGQKLVFVQNKGIPLSTFEGIVVDAASAKRIGTWESSTSMVPFIGEDYLHDDGDKGEEKRVEFVVKTEKPGRYEVRISYTQNPNRSKNVPVEIVATEGTVRKTVDQTRVPEIDRLFVSLGTFAFGKEARIVIGNAGTRGFVVVDAVQLLRKD